MTNLPSSHFFIMPSMPRQSLTTIASAALGWSLALASCTAGTPTQNSGGSQGDGGGSASGGDGGAGALPTQVPLGDAQLGQWTFNPGDASAEIGPGGAGGGAPTSSCAAELQDSMAFGTAACEGAGTWSKGNALDNGRIEFVLEFDDGGRATYAQFPAQAPDLADGARVEFFFEQAKGWAGSSALHWTVKRSSDGQVAIEGGFADGNTLDSGPDLDTASEMLGVTVSVSDGEHFTYANDCHGPVTAVLKDLTLEADEPIVIETANTELATLPKGTFSISWRAYENLSEVDIASSCEDFDLNADWIAFEAILLPKTK